MRLSRKAMLCLKVVAHLIGILPLVYLLMQLLMDKAGGDPVQYIIHFTGMGAINALVLTLLLSPVAKRLKWGGLLSLRRLVGLYTFSYASLHLMAFISLDLVFNWSLLWSEVLQRRYILFGMAAYLVLLALAVTSFAYTRRKMGAHWQRLHNCIYLIAVLVPIHFYWSVKSEIIEPSIYLLLLFILVAMRYQKFKLRLT